MFERSFGCRGAAMDKLFGKPFFNLCLLELAVDETLFNHERKIGFAVTLESGEF